MSPKLRVVFDTNVLISGIIFGGNARACLELARQGDIQLVTSKAILLELSQKLSLKFHWSDYETANIIRGLKVFSQIADLKTQIDAIKIDPPDNQILETAHDGYADLIISGDQHHLLPIKTFRGIKIISPAEFLKQR